MKQSENISKTSEDTNFPTPEEQPALFADPASNNSGIELRVKKGANWFIWIAIFGLVGFILERINPEKDWFFGLAAPKWLESQLAGSQIPVFLLLLVMVVAFGVIGYLSGKGKSLPYLFGLVLYLVDTVTAFLLQDLLLTVFHIIAIIGLLVGLFYLSKLVKTKAERPSL